MVKVNHITSKIVERPIALWKKGYLQRDRVATLLRRLAVYPLPDAKRFGTVYGEGAIKILRDKGILPKNVETLETLTFAEVNADVKISTLRAFVAQFNQENPDAKIEYTGNKLKPKIPQTVQIQIEDKNIQVPRPAGQDSVAVSTPSGTYKIPVVKPEKEIVYKAIANTPYGLDETALLEQTGIDKSELYASIGELSRSKRIRAMPHLKNGKFILRYRTSEQRKRLREEGKTFFCVDENVFPFTAESEDELNSGAVIPVIAGDDTIYYHSSEAFQKLKTLDEKKKTPNRNFATYLDKEGNEKIIYTKVAERWIIEGRVAPALDSKGSLQAIDLRIASQYQRETLNYYVERILYHASSKKKLPPERQLLIESAAAFCLENYGHKKIEGRIPVLNHCLSTAAIVASLGGDPITITAALLHKESNLSKNLDKLQRTAPGLKKELNDVPVLIERLLKAVKQPYWPPKATGKRKRKPRYHIQNHIDMILNLTLHPNPNNPREVRHDHRVMLLIFADKLDEVQNITLLPRSQRARENLYNEIRHIFASLAIRFFFSELYYKFLNQIFRMRDPEKFKEIETKVRAEHKDSPDKIRALMEKMANVLRRRILKIKSYGKPEVYFRQKFEQSIYEKTVELDKDDDYGEEIGRLLDLLGFFVITERKIYDKLEAQKLVGEALDSFIKILIVNRTRTTEKTGAHHVNVFDKKDRGVEVQLMSKEEFRKYRISDAAYWVHKLRELTGQAFDIEIIKAYAHKITGEFENDFNVVTEPLQDVVLVNYYDENREMRIRRLNRGAVPVDLAAARSINALNEDYAGAEVAEFDKDKEGKPKIISWMKVPEYHQFKDGDLVRFTKRGRKKLKNHELRKELAEKHCTNIRARLLLTLWDKSEFKKRIEKGRKFASQANLFRGMKKKEILVFAAECGLANINELYAALADIELTELLIEEAKEGILKSLADKEKAERFVKKLETFIKWLERKRLS